MDVGHVQDPISWVFSDMDDLSFVFYLRCGVDLEWSSRPSSVALLFFGGLSCVANLVVQDVLLASMHLVTRDIPRLPRCFSSIVPAALLSFFLVLP